MKQLKNGQEVIFIIKDKNYKYEVHKSFLKEEDSHNDQIFIDLKIDQVKFAYSAYGYHPGNGYWPESNYGDFAALTRIVEALFPYCDKVTVDGNIVYSKSEKTIFKKSDNMEQLNSGDKIIFTIKDKNYIYTVYSQYLCLRSSGDNDQIFKDLKLDKFKFCFDCYGYTPGTGDWPESKDRDYTALTRIVEALFPYCDEVTVNGEVVYSKSEKTIFKESESSISSSKLESSNTIDFESIVKNPKIKLTFI